MNREIDFVDELILC